MEKEAVLIVSSDMELLKVFGKIFRKKGYRAENAQASDEATQRIKNEKKYVAVLIDENTFETNTASLVVAIREIAPDVAQIVLTNMYVPEKEIENLSAGAHAYLLKPAQPIQIFDAIKRRQC